VFGKGSLLCFSQPAVWNAGLVPDQASFLLPGRMETRRIQIVFIQGTERMLIVSISQRHFSEVTHEKDNQHDPV
jgi:hypothetical protein